MVQTEQTVWSENLANLAADKKFQSLHKFQAGMEFDIKLLLLTATGSRQFPWLEKRKRMIFVK
jgi:hypothetical protein